eukprot:4336272-Amphidinium_carterae.1
MKGAGWLPHLCVCRNGGYDSGRLVTGWSIITTTRRGLVRALRFSDTHTHTLACPCQQGKRRGDATPCWRYFV